MKGGWFGLRYGVRISLPVPAVAVVQFVVDHAQRTTDVGLRHELPASIRQPARQARPRPPPLRLVQWRAAPLRGRRSRPAVFATRRRRRIRLRAGPIQDQPGRAWLATIILTG